MKTIVIEFTLTRETAAAFIEDPEYAESFRSRDPAELRCRIVIKGYGGAAVYWQDISEVDEPFWRGGSHDSGPDPALGGLCLDRQTIIAVALRMLVTGQVTKEMRELPSGTVRYELGKF